MTSKLDTGRSADFGPLSDVTRKKEDSLRDDFKAKKVSKDFFFDSNSCITDLDRECLTQTVEDETNLDSIVKCVPDFGSEGQDSEDESSREGSSSEKEDDLLQEDAYFCNEEIEVHDSFIGYNLSRPLNKAISEMGFSRPTPIQSKTIPAALQGRDICASAVTGSGKTGAFLIPIIERLAYRDKNVCATRVLIMVPTRELGIQCLNVAKNLTKYTTIKTCLCVGGVNLKQQSAELSENPEIIVATPGRIIDHVINTKSFSLDNIEILVLDEADKMLEEGFMDELREIIKNTPMDRQVLLFSATMTDKVEDLAALSLKRPIKLFVDSSEQITKTLAQEIVRVRSHREENKPGMLVALSKNTYSSSVIIFFNEKSLTHKMKRIFDIVGLNAVELHGDLSQDDRLKSLKDFKDKKADFLLCTDLAARGIDIPRVKVVINYDMPSKYKQYVHRVGRTARAGFTGCAVSFVCEDDRKVMRKTIRNSSIPLKQRTINPNHIEHFQKIIDENQDKIEELLTQDKKNMMASSIIMKYEKARNIINHKNEIMNRPKRAWFKSTTKKRAHTNSDKKNKKKRPSKSFK